MITGGTGYIGARLVSLARRQGHRITLLSRHPETPGNDSSIRQFHWTLGEQPPLDAFAEGAGFGTVDVLVYLAHEWHSGRPEKTDKNLSGTEKLLTAARARNVGRIVFCSSVSARQGALNRYGRVKWAIEQLLKPPAEIVARIGLVYGGPSSGQWGTLSAMVRATPILPVPYAGTLVQPIHLDEVCAGLLALSEAPDLKKSVYGLAGVEPLSFGRFLKLVAHNLYDRRLSVIPIPAWLALAGAGITGILPFVPSVDRERILGAAGIPTIETAADLAELGLSLRPVAESLASEAADAGACPSLH